MGVAIVLGVFLFIWLMKALFGASPTTLGAVMKRGIAARGILLSVSNTPSGSVGQPPWRFQLRSVVMDIEIPGQPPYEAAVIVHIPSNLVRDVLPGATVELRLSAARSNTARIVVVGPGAGFNAQLLNATTGPSQ